MGAVGLHRLYVISGAHINSLLEVDVDRLQFDKVTSLFDPSQTCPTSQQIRFPTPLFFLLISCKGLDVRED